MDFLVWLEGTFIANAIRTIPWLYPMFETGHYIGLSLLVGGIMLIDLRVLGFARALPLRSMIGLLPFVWIGFLINVFTGSMLFIYGATNFGPNRAFQVKNSIITACTRRAGPHKSHRTRRSATWPQRSTSDRTTPPAAPTSTGRSRATCRCAPRLPAR